MISRVPQSADRHAGRVVKGLGGHCGGDAVATWVPLDEVPRLRLAEGLAEFLHEHGIVSVIA